jgi:hypothetical protein
VLLKPTEESKRSRAPYGQPMLSSSAINVIKLQERSVGFTTAYTFSPVTLAHLFANGFAPLCGLGDASRSVFPLRIILSSRLGCRNPTDTTQRLSLYDLARTMSAKSSLATLLIKFLAHPVHVVYDSTPKKEWL